MMKRAALLGLYGEQQRIVRKEAGTALACADQGSLCEGVMCVLYERQRRESDDGATRREGKMRGRTTGINRILVRSMHAQ